MKKYGFTLIELLIVVTIIAILVVAGSPSYMSYLRESRRQDAIQGILTLQITIENYIAQNNSLPPTSTTTSANGWYTITYTPNVSPPLTYQIAATATPGSTQVNDKAGGTISCATITLQSTTTGMTPYVCK